MASAKSRKVAVISLFGFQLVLIVLFSIFVKYDATSDEALAQPNEERSDLVESMYPMFQDIHVMVFIGFGFLMAFLRKYGYSAIGFTFLISALVMQWGLLCRGFFKMQAENGLIHIDVVRLIGADVMAAAVMISLGAVLGKISLIQLLIMAVFETIFLAFNEYLGVEVLGAVDTGGSMYTHMFGAYFGLAVSYALSGRGVATEEDNNELESSSYQSDINAMIGSLFLWMFWPSFNAALVSGDEKHRAIINTYLALSASCLSAFAISSVTNKNTKIDMVHVQNATLAGGVCVGTSANLIIQPYGAILIGSFAGILSTLGFCFLQDAVSQKLRIHDTCGVNNLHGMPGIAGGIIGSLMAATADPSTYGTKLYNMFPAMGPTLNRTALQQAGYQLLAVLITFCISIVSGVTTGLFIRNFTRIEKPFDDGSLWNLPKERAKHNRECSVGQKT